MLNHARTLLLNALPAPGTLGEEYIPPDYKVRRIPAYLAHIRKILVGDSREAQNYRVRQLMTVIHGTELAEYIYKLDPRVTYWPTTDSQCFKKEPADLVPLAQVIQTLTETVGDDLWTLFSGHGANFPVFWEYWNEYKQPQYRLAAVTLAVIYRMDVGNELGIS